MTDGAPFPVWIHGGGEDDLPATAAEVSSLGLGAPLNLPLAFYKRIGCGRAVNVNLCS